MKNTLSASLVLSLSAGLMSAFLLVSGPASAVQNVRGEDRDLHHEQMRGSDKPSTVIEIGQGRVDVDHDGMNAVNSASRSEVTTPVGPVSTEKHSE